MKILLIAGHGEGDSGAVGGGYTEAELTREAAVLFKAQFDKYCTCDIADMSKDWFRYTKQHGFIFSGYDYMLELHFNSGGGTGTEIYTPVSRPAGAAEKNIVAAVSKAGGFANRGTKQKNFTVIASAAAKGVDGALLEICFIDSASDMQRYGEKKQQIAAAAAEAAAQAWGLEKLTEKEELTMSQYEELKQEIAKTDEENNRQNDVLNAVGRDIETLRRERTVYNYIDDNMPEWARETVRKLADKGIIKGDDSGLGLTEDMLRILVMLDRAGAFGV